MSLQRIYDLLHETAALVPDIQTAENSTECDKLFSLLKRSNGRSVRDER